MRGKLEGAWARFALSLNPHYKIGMRVVKTALCVAICLLIAWLTDSMSVMQIAAISAIIAIKPSQEDSLHTGAIRLIGTLIGGMLGVVCILLGRVIPYYENGLFVVVIPLVMLADCYVCNVLGLQEALVISSVVVLLVGMQTGAPADYAFAYAWHRAAATLIGVVLATAINMLIPYKENAQPPCDAQNGAKAEEMEKPDTK